MNDETVSNDKRRFSRVAFASKALVSNEKKQWPCQLIDISLKGSLITLPANWTGVAGDQFQLEILLDSSEIAIRMDVSVAHIENNHIGLTCEHIDIDSISHLRRLVELNLGNSEALQRELSELINHEELPTP